MGLGLGVGPTKELAGVCQVVLDRLAADAEPGGDFLMGEVMEAAEQEDLPAGRGEVGEEFLQELELGAGLDDALDGGGRAGRELERGRVGAGRGIAAPGAEPVEGEPAAHGEEKAARRADRAAGGGGVILQEGILGDVLGGMGAAQQAAEVAVQRRDRGLVHGEELLLLRGLRRRRRGRAHTRRCGQDRLMLGGWLTHGGNLATSQTPRRPERHAICGGWRWWRRRIGRIHGIGPMLNDTGRGPSPLDEFAEF